MTRLAKTIIYAPIMALSAAPMLLVNSFDTDTPKWRQAVRNTLGAIFAGLSAYFWIAEAMEKHPLDGEVWQNLGWLFAVMIVYALIAAVIIVATATSKDE